MWLSYNSRYVVPCLFWWLLPLGQSFVVIVNRCQKTRPAVFHRGGSETTTTAAALETAELVERITNNINHNWDVVDLTAGGVAVLSLLGLAFLSSSWQKQPPESSNNNEQQTNETTTTARTSKDSNVAAVVQTTPEQESSSSSSPPSLLTTTVTPEEDKKSSKMDDSDNDDLTLDQQRAMSAFQQGNETGLRQALRSLADRIRTARAAQAERQRVVESELRDAAERLRQIEDDYELEQTARLQATELLQDAQQRLDTTQQRLNQTQESLVTTRQELADLRAERQSLRKLSGVAWQLSRERVQTRMRSVRERVWDAVSKNKNKEEENR